jgi:very-short-patch-repair endonuclease
MMKPRLRFNPGLVESARELRKNQTPAERKLWFEYLRKYNYRVLRQRPIDQYIVDFYCDRLHLVIEVDGSDHFTEKGEAYDQQRTEILIGYGLTVLRFSNRDVLDHFEGVCRVLESFSSDEESPLPPLERGA